MASYPARTNRSNMIASINVRSQRKKARVNEIPVPRSSDHGAEALQWSKYPDEEAKDSDYKLFVKQKPSKVVLVPDISGEVEIHDGVTAIYSVHRSVLQSRSGYFRDILEAGGVDSHSSTAIDLPSSSLLTVSHFESILEFCYAGTTEIQVFNAVPLNYLGQSLRIEALTKETFAYLENALLEVKLNPDLESWIDKSLVVSIWHRYAKALSMTGFAYHLSETLQRHPDLVAQTEALSKIPNPVFFGVWEVFKRQTHCCPWVVASDFWSDSVADYINENRHVVNKDIFGKLTACEALPVISPDAAIRLMEHEQALFRTTAQGDESHNNELTFLQARCIRALYNRKTQAWQDSPSLARPNHKAFEFRCGLYDRLEKLPRPVLRSIVNQTIFAAPPTPVVEVTGAGMHGVNGVYRLGCVRGELAFCRSVTGWGHGGCVYYIAKGVGGKYFLGFLDPVCNHGNILYQAREQHTGGILYPETGWSPVHGIAPAPTLRQQIPSGFFV